MTDFEIEKDAFKQRIEETLDQGTIWAVTLDALRDQFQVDTNAVVFKADEYGSLDVELYMNHDIAPTNGEAIVQLDSLSEIARDIFHDNPLSRRQRSEAHPVLENQDIAIFPAYGEDDALDRLTVLFRDKRVNIKRTEKEWATETFTVMHNQLRAAERADKLAQDWYIDNNDDYGPELNCT